MNRIGRREEKRERDEDLFKTIDSTLDSSTSLAVIQVMRKLNIESILGAIASGKEAKVYPAKTRDGKYIALKIYYTSTASHKRAIRRYVSLDRRVEVRFSSTKEMIYAWARKEFGNLQKMFEAGVRVPKPFLLIKNVLAMEFVGDGISKAPLLVDLEEVTQELYDEIIRQIEVMVTKAQLIHGDLSEFNVMVKDELPYIIDVGQAIPVWAENSLSLLERDINNINRFFEERGIDVVPVKELLNRLQLSS
ncbi:Non-specific serine/threonine protein kinase [Metallosphaera sedula]|uniref:non-specific serine/threonine protein kinase n=3 Tax=Metallosphaera TaxID=41980 RepID=A4YEH7_METS5|nr:MULTISPECIES: serine protein kinase RIO [Metallosphaera]ABP94829.1 Non-specific serine/threonine protein kinase [Metallosphaera sedula DSM 5348]AIM26816.1 Non-specific serine/threonine protein kinase [Metallosphaera sedula]AKV73765.1 serine/threonine protein kinase [Metallosphaera sedula]AKV76005.1 serine/threonine protein kinase [Metallosphaera sedula]AKV78256.1 serine/threonine protein kinase [Metallosphaera sedula]